MNIRKNYKKKVSTLYRDMKNLERRKLVHLNN